MTQMIPPAEALPLQSLITPPSRGSRVACKTAGGNLTRFVFDTGQDS